MENLSRVALILFFICFGTSAAEKININTASSDDLVKIIHIGEARALELISLRPFSSLDDLAKIKGIGPARLEDIKKQGIAYVEKNIWDVTDPPEIIKPMIDTETETETAAQQLAKELPETSFEAETIAPFKVDINAASSQELQEIVGIGAAFSQRIIDMRPFYSLDELVKVHGIGAKTLENIKSQGLAWVDPELTFPKTEKMELFGKELTSASVPLRQNQNKQFQKGLPVFLTAFFLAFFSGTTILILKKNLKTIS